MTPLGVAREAARILAGLGLAVDVVPVPDMCNGNVLVWTPGGYGVSLITWPPDEWPELLIKHRDAGDGWMPPRQVALGTGKGERLTDPVGNVRNVTPGEVAAVLATLAEWPTGE